MIKSIFRISIICLMFVGLAFSFPLHAEKENAADLCSYENAVRQPEGGVDIEAAFTNQWGSGVPPIKIFGRDAALGEVVSATLDESDEKYALRSFEYPLPAYNACPGYGYFRDADMSVISRITVWSWRQIILIRHAGGRGFRPGSEGYVQLIGDEWKIVDVLSVEGPDNSYFGSGVNVDMENGRIEWQGRGACPACACLENSTRIAVVVEKNPVGPTYTTFTSNRSTSADVEAAVTNQWGWGGAPLKIFGQDAGTGQSITAPLREYDQKYALHSFEDPLARYSRCPGFGYYRDADISFITRVSLGNQRVLILVRHHGARGYKPGSEGYVQLGGDYQIEKVVSAQNDNSAYGYGVRIDLVNGTIEWQGRTGCPGCACHEGPVFIAVVACKKSNPTITSLEPDSGPIGTSVTVYGSSFGHLQGTVTFNGIAAQTVDSWTDTEIVARVPRGADTGPVQVHTADNKHSNDIIFTVQDLQAGIDIKPDTFNKKSKGKWVTAYIELPEGFGAEEIAVDSIAIVKVNTNTLEAPIHAELKPTATGDYDGDGIADLMVKFNREALAEEVQKGNCLLTIVGKLTDNTAFRGYETLKVIH